MSKVACYVRDSTRRRKDDAQRSEIQKWLDGNGIDPEQVVWYADKEMGSTLHRPAFERLQSAIFMGNVKTVVLWKLDPMSRRLKDGVNIFADWCEWGLRIVVVTQQIELNGPVGRMITAVMLGLAEIELEYRRERQVAGIEVARKKGIYTGRKAGTTIGKPECAREPRDKELSVPESSLALGVSERTVFRYLGKEAA